MSGRDITALKVTTHASASIEAAHGAVFFGEYYGEKLTTDRRQDVINHDDTLSDAKANEQANANAYDTSHEKIEKHVFHDVTLSIVQVLMHVHHGQIFPPCAQHGQGFH